MDETNGFEGIVNGTPTNYNSWKGAVALMWGYSGVICTGIMIDSEVVLSAGHCVLLADLGLDLVSNPGQLWIAGGANVMTAPIHLADVSSVIAHPNWDGYSWGTDLSMIKLSSPVTDVPHYNFRHSPQASVGELVKIVGYGLTGGTDYESGGVHRMGDSSILMVTSEEIEIGGETNGCFGDSGGPLFSYQDNEWVVSGVTSHGEEAETCYADHGGWYVNILTYLDWIDETMWNMTGHGIGPDTDTDVDTDTETDTDTDTDTETGTGSDTTTEETDAGEPAPSPIEHACYCGLPGARSGSPRGVITTVLSVIL